MTFEFRATRWNVVVPSPPSLQDLGAALWDLQQQLNPAYTEGPDSLPSMGDKATAAMTSTSSSSLSSSALPRRMLALPPSFPDELNILQRLLPFPEEVALKLTESEFELFNSVPPIDYLRHCTTDLTARHHPSSQPTNAQPADNGVPSLIRRFNEVRLYSNYAILLAGLCSNATAMGHLQKEKKKKKKIPYNFNSLCAFFLLPKCWPPHPSRARFISPL